MARPANPNPTPRTNLVKRKQRNGWKHVYKVTSVYDPKIRNSRAIATELVGKIPPEFDDIEHMVPTRKRAKPKSKKEVTVVDQLPGTRQQGKVVYKLDLVLLTILLASFQAMTSCRQIAEFWKVQRPILQKHFEDFPATDISHDTVRRIIMLLGRDNMNDLIARFTEPLIQSYGKRVIAFDGHAVKATQNSAKGSPSRYILNVFDTDSGLVLEQRLVEAKSNEIKACTSLVDQIDIKGCIVTADALNTQTQFAKKILEKRADYCLAVKSNQGLTYEEIKETFASKFSECAKDHEQIDFGHGRIETRIVRVFPGHYLTSSILKKWEGLQEGCIVEATTDSVEKATGVITSHKRYFITSLNYDERYICQQLLRTIRNHWGIENSLHWVLDVTFSQDRTQCKNAEYLQGKTRLNKIVFNVMSRVQTLEQEQTGKEAPSKAVLKARYSNIEAALNDLYRTLG